MIIKDKELKILTGERLKEELKKISPEGKKIIKIATATLVGIAIITSSGIVIKKAHDSYETRQIVSHLKSDSCLDNPIGYIDGDSVKKKDKKDYVFIRMQDDKINEDEINEILSSGKDVGIIYTPVDYTYESLYKGIYKLKDIISKNSINCPILYDISKYMSDDTIRANCRLGSAFCSKLSANGCYVGFYGSNKDMIAYDERYREEIGSSIDLYDKLIEILTLKDKISYNGVYNMVYVVDKTTVYEKYDLSKTIEEMKLNDENSFVDDYVYTIVSGDTLSGISSNYNIKMSDMISYNKFISQIDTEKFDSKKVITDENASIYPGQILVLPNLYGKDASTIVEKKSTISSESVVEEVSETQDKGTLKKGIDVSQFNGNIDYEEVKKNIDFMIIRMGDFALENFTDYKYEENLSMSEKYQIPNSIYYVSRAVTEQGQINEAEKILENLKGTKFEYPIYLDIEYDSSLNTLITNNPYEAASILRKSLKLLQNNGYYVGIYCCEATAECLKPTGIFNEYSLWLTCGKTYKENYKPNNIPLETLRQNSYIPTDTIGIRQLSDKGSCDGVPSEFCDIDVAYSDLSDTVVKGGFNNY